MCLLSTISRANKRIPRTIRFLIGLVLFNIPPIIYLNIVGTNLSSIYVAIIFLLINVCALIAYFKFEEIEVNSGFGMVKIRK